MAEGYKEREEWIAAGEWLIRRLQARLEDRVIEEDIELEVANKAPGAIL